MAQRFSPNTSVAEQILLNPTFANIDFADFQGLDMNLIDRNAEYTQNIANKRFEGMLEAQAKFLEEVKLDKKFDYLEKDLQNKLASVIDNAGNVQLSDNANFNKLNTSLISLKADPQLKRAVYSSEQARKMQEILQNDPTLEKRLWDAPATINYRKFLNGETNDFELTPIYKNVDLTSVWDGFFSKLPTDQQEVLRDYGTYGLVQAKQEGRNVDQLIDAIKDFKNFTIKNNPEIVSHLERRGNYEVTTNPNVNKDQFINDYIDESARAAASKVAGISNTISSVGIKPDATMDLQWKQENRMQTAQDKQNEFYAPYDFKGGVLVKGNKPVTGAMEKDALKNGVAAYLIPENGIVNTTSTSTVNGKNVTVQSKKLVDPNSLYITTVNGQNVLKGYTLKKKPIDPIPVPPNVMLDVLNQMGGRGNSTTQGTGVVPPPANMQGLFQKYNLK